MKIKITSIKNIDKTIKDINERIKVIDERIKTIDKTIKVIKPTNEIKDIIPSYEKEISCTKRILDIKNNLLNLSLVKNQN